MTSNLGLPEGPDVLGYDCVAHRFRSFRYAIFFAPCLAPKSFLANRQFYCLATPNIIGWEAPGVNRARCNCPGI